MSAAEYIEVTDAPDRDRFELSIDGEVVGFTAYRARPGLIAFIHTEIDERFQGRGLEPEQPRVPTRVRLPEGGPALLEGDLELEGNRETRAALCRCGKSANQPYCDHSGPCQQWEFQRGERSA